MFQSLKDAIGKRVAANARVHAQASKRPPSGAVVKNILPTSSPATAAAAASTATHTTMNYHMSTIRWHLDTREHESILFLHDLGSNASSWSQLDIEAATLPNTGLTPTVPLHLYMPHLRNHGLGHFVNNSTVGDYVGDVVAFANEVILPTSPVHIVGYGFGARVGLLVALANPSRISSVTAITNGNPFGSITPPSQRIEALARLCGECSSLAELNEKLRETVVNDTERLNLLLSVKEIRSPNGKKLELMMNSAELIRYANSGIGKWPTLRNEDGTEGEQQAVFAALKAHAGDVKCHVIKSTLGGATSVDSERLNALFSSPLVTEMPANFSLGMLRKEDTRVVLHKILDKTGLIGTMAESNIDGAKVAAEMMAQ